MNLICLIHYYCRVIVHLLGRLERPVKYSLANDTTNKWPPTKITSMSSSFIYNIYIYIYTTISFVSVSRVESSCTRLNVESSESSESESVESQQILG
jgi:hypothetical protein